jgi:hypothetical protein
MAGDIIAARNAVVISRVFFDIDGTLVSENDSIRPHAKEIVMELIKAGIQVIFWSGGGLDYAATWANRIHPYVRSGCKNLREIHKSDFVVDDMTAVVDIAIKKGADGYVIPQFVKDDSELLHVRDLILKKRE